uniref:UDP-galactopyranose mutase C-terminal domain-containing protein n=1 Tax=Aplanochytrium stocchinoi TaxID=215587 RepID=A0A7S3PRB2_9STRA|mmetsp:Transcript_6514/g.7922  ORF Transcript_6514/g.7922 Transcript_6514/m.7922 type:complete len:511 (+) Transcript_6514:49-1581(+)
MHQRKLSGSRKISGNSRAENMMRTFRTYAAKPERAPIAKIISVIVSLFCLYLGFRLLAGPVAVSNFGAGAGLRLSEGSKYSNRIDYSQEYDVCTVGAGLSGVIFAERYANVLGKKALVLDVRDHVGGNCYDYYDAETGILMNKYGAHLFHTNSEKAWRYLNMHKNAPKWERWDHEVRGWVKGKLVPIPANINTVNRLFNNSIQSEEEMKAWLAKVQIPCPKSGCQNAEQMAKSRVGMELYEAIFHEYTIKQWAKEPSELDALVTARIPLRTNFDNRYFGDRYQALPSKGYTAWFDALLDNVLIDTVLGVNYFDHKQHLDRVCKKVIYTGPIDRFFADKGLGKLEYRSIDFVEERYFNVGGYMQPMSVVNYPGKEVGFTRIVEYKHMLYQKSPHTILVKEFSKSTGDPYYPVPNEKNQLLYDQYKQLAEEAEESGELDVHFVGRLANYKYFNMDATIENALNMFYEIAGKPEMKDMPGLFGKQAKQSNQAYQDSISDSFSVASKPRGNKKH